MQIIITPRIIPEPVVDWFKDAARVHTELMNFGGGYAGVHLAAGALIECITGVAMTWGLYEAWQRGGKKALITASIKLGISVILAVWFTGAMFDWFRLLDYYFSRL